VISFLVHSHSLRILLAFVFPFLSAFSITMKLPIPILSLALLYKATNSVVSAVNLFEFEVDIDHDVLSTPSPLLTFQPGGTSAGNIEFCARVETEFTGLDGIEYTVAFQETDYNIAFTMENNTITALNATFVADAVQTVQEDIENVFGISACLCSDTSFACGAVQPIQQDDWLYVCVQPSANTVNITNFGLTLTNPDVSGFTYVPVAIGTETWRIDDLTTVTTGIENNIDVVRAQLYLVADLFDAGDTVTVTGSAVLGFKGSQGSSRTIDDFHSFEFNLPIEPREEEECSGFFATLLNLFK